MPRIDYDELMTGRPTRQQIAQAFQEGFQEEHYLVGAIRLHLMSQADKRIIEQQNSSIEDMLNGRVEGGGVWVQQMFERWNATLGFRCFGA